MSNIPEHMWKDHHNLLGARTPTKFANHFDLEKATEQAQRLVTINKNNRGTILKSNNYMLYAFCMHSFENTSTMMVEISTEKAQLIMISQQLLATVRKEC